MIDNVSQQLRQRSELWIDQDDDSVLDLSAAETIEYLKTLVADLIPFMLNDVKNGLYLDSIPEDHHDDDCPDCLWYKTSVEWDQRIAAGEFNEFLLNN